jgi:hypothetical protein
LGREQEEEKEKEQERQDLREQRKTNHHVYNQTQTNKRTNGRVERQQKGTNLGELVAFAIPVASKVIGLSSTIGCPRVSKNASNSCITCEQERKEGRKRKQTTTKQTKRKGKKKKNTVSEYRIISL